MGFLPHFCCNECQCVLPMFWHDLKVNSLVIYPLLTSDWLHLLLPKLRFLGLQRVGHDWATELNWSLYKGLPRWHSGKENLPANAREADLNPGLRRSPGTRVTYVLIPYSPAITLLGIHPKDLKTSVYTEICTHVFIESLSIIAKSCKQPSCPSVGEWITVVHTDNGTLISAEKKWGVKPWKDMEEL